MAYLIYTNMQKRSGQIYADMHKTDERIYFTEEEARTAIDADPEIAPYRHVVPIVCMTEDEYQELIKEKPDAVEDR